MNISAPIDDSNSFHGVFCAITISVNIVRKIAADVRNASFAVI